jgi:ABC-2 type transport system ATP-binding protein
MADDCVALETAGLGKRYSHAWALRDFTIRLPKGRIAALVGPNGAGKSTLMRMAVGITRPSTGTLRILGGSPNELQADVLSRIGYLDQERPVYEFLRVEEMLRAGRSLNPRWDDPLAHRYLADLAIPLRSRIGRLSIGQQAQVAMVMCLAKRPELLVLDEPVAALDPLARHQLMGLLLQSVAEGGTTVLFASHVIGDLEAVCDFVVILNRSRLAVADDLSHLLASHQLLVGAEPNLSVDAGDLVQIVSRTTTGRQTDLLVRTETPIADPRWEIHEPTLEEIVLAYLRRDGESQTEVKR